MVSFVPEAALIALREGLEALLILGLLLGLATRFKSAPGRRAVWVGFAGGVALSLLLGLVIQRTVAGAFERFGGALFELVAAGIAVVIVTYMVVWMGDHTRALARSVARRAEAALMAGTPWVLGLLVGVTTLREGLETVLFYAALMPDAGATSVLASGLAGVAASAVLAAGLFQAATRLSIGRVFFFSGAFLVLVAAGLLVHVAHAAADLGWIPRGTLLWDTSVFIPAERADGRILHALVGYTPDPTALQLFLYLGYVLGAGGVFLARTGVALARPVRAGALVGACVALAALGAMALADDGAHGHRDDALAAAGMAPDAWPDGARVGILYRSHGEPVEYNASTYASFATFTREILVLYGMEHVLAIDQGTVLVDSGAPFAPTPRLAPRLMDAWTGAWNGPSVPLPAGSETPVLGDLADGAFHLAPGIGPGLGEPDILEMAGLGAYRAWTKMGGRSPMHADEAVVRGLVKDALASRFGERVVVAEAWHAEPKVRAGESFHDAVQALKDAGATHVVDLYLSSVGSDVMDTCIMRPHLDGSLAHAGFDRVVHVGAPGLQPAWARGTAETVGRAAADVPPDAPLAVFLTQHGLTAGSRNPCGTGPDRYHGAARAQFAAAETAVRERLAGRPGPVQVLHVYAQGAEAADDGVLSPLEAFERARRDGATQVLDLPYEFVGDGFDTLVVAREAWGFEPGQHPYFGPGRETVFTRQGVLVRILSGAAAPEAKAEAHLATIDAGLATLWAADGGASPHDHAPRWT